MDLLQLIPHVISPWVIGVLIHQTDACAVAELNGPLVHQGGGGDIPQRNPARIEKDRFRLALPARLAPGGDLTELGVDPVAGDRPGVERVMQVAGLIVAPPICTRE
jgi:hypothetical protein